MAMTKEQRGKLTFIKSECNSPKRRLMEYMRQVEQISPRKAEALGKIIGRLEQWQNTN